MKYKGVREGLASKEKKGTPHVLKKKENKRKTDGGQVSRLQVLGGGGPQKSRKKEESW